MIETVTEFLMRMTIVQISLVPQHKMLMDAQILTVMVTVILVTYSLPIPVNGMTLMVTAMVMPTMEMIQIFSHLMQVNGMILMVMDMATTQKGMILIHAPKRLEIPLTLD
jgi:hypothetical protein